MAELIVDTARIRHNARIVLKQAQGAQVMGVVKGNGYGLGLVAYARTLIGCGVRMLAVAALDEALTLRSAGISEDILLMAPLSRKTEIRAAVQQNVIVTVASPEDVQAVVAVSAMAGIAARVHLCVDTGFGRHGFALQRPDLILAAARKLQGVRMEGIFSHFSDAAGRRAAATQRQLAQFLHVCAMLKGNGIPTGMRHIAASSALLRFPQARLDAVRVGSAFLGRISIRDDWGFQPVGYLSCPVEAVYTRACGQHVGYGCGATVHRDTKMAVLPVGYGCGVGLTRMRVDGGLKGALANLHQALFRRTVQPMLVQIGSAACPVLGGVGFTACVVDVTGIDCQPGDRACIPVNPLWIDSGVRRTYVCMTGAGTAERFGGLENIS